LRNLDVLAIRLRGSCRHKQKRQDCGKRDFHVNPLDNAHQRRWLILLQSLAKKQTRTPAFSVKKVIR